MIHVINRRNLIEVDLINLAHILRILVGIQVTIDGYLFATTDFKLFMTPVRQLTEILHLNFGELMDVDLINWYNTESYITRDNMLP